MPEATAHERELRRAAAVGQALARARHDLNNLFHVAAGWSRLLRDPRSSPDRMQEGVSAVLIAADRIGDLIGGILALDGPPSTGPALCDLPQRLTELGRGLGQLLVRPERLSIEIGTGSLALCDYSELRGALVDFVLDIRDTLGDDGLRLRLAAAEPNPADAPSVPQVELELTRVPAQPEAPVPAGQRLCLRFAAELANAASAGDGTSPATNTISGRDVLADNATPSPSVIPKSSSPVVLLVDDHRDVRRLAATMLERAGYQVLTACDADEALGTSRTYDGPIQVLCCDAQMPGLPAAKLIAELRSARPELRVLVCTGEQPQPGLNDYPHLSKPFSYQQLVSAVRLCHD